MFSLQHTVMKWIDNFLYCRSIAIRVDLWSSVSLWCASGLFYLSCTIHPLHKWSAFRYVFPYSFFHWWYRPKFIFAFFLSTNSFVISFKGLAILVHSLHLQLQWYQQGVVSPFIFISLISYVDFWSTLIFNQFKCTLICIFAKGIRLYIDVHLCIGLFVFSHMRLWNKSMGTAKCCYQLMIEEV